MPWWSVGIDGKVHGPFPSSKEGRSSACAEVAGEDPYVIMPGWKHDGAVFSHTADQIDAIGGVVMEPPPKDETPTDLFPIDSKYSRTQLSFMRSRFLGTVYKTKLELR